MGKADRRAKVEREKLALDNPEKVGRRAKADREIPGFEEPSKELSSKSSQPSVSKRWQPQEDAATLLDDLARRSGGSRMSARDSAAAKWASPAGFAFAQPGTKGEANPATRSAVSALSNGKSRPTGARQRGDTPVPTGKPAARQRDNALTEAFTAQFQPLSRRKPAKACFA